MHHRVVIAPADQALDGEQGVLGIGHRLSLRGLADQDLLVLGERHDGWRGAIALAVLDHLRRVPFHDGHAGVGGTEVNTNHSSHVSLPRFKDLSKKTVAMLDGVRGREIQAPVAL